MKPIKSGRHKSLNKRQAATYTVVHVKYPYINDPWTYNSKCHCQRVSKARNREYQRQNNGRLPKYEKLKAKKY